MKLDCCNHTIWGWSPLLLCFMVLLVYPLSPVFYDEILTPEDGIIEWLTVVFSLVAVGLVARLLFNAKSYQLTNFDIVLLGLYGLASIFFAGEEISWGQRLIGIETEQISPTLAEINKQDELNLHNISGLSQVRLIADVFCLVWGIIVPLIYNRSSKQFPIPALRNYVAPNWLIPGFATYLLITWPHKITTMLFSEEAVQITKSLRLGELKETVFGLIILLFALHIVQVMHHRYANPAAET